MWKQEESRQAGWEVTAAVAEAANDGGAGGECDIGAARFGWVSGDINGAKQGAQDMARINGECESEGSDGNGIERRREQKGFF
jgi:hypothetical protein